MEWYALKENFNRKRIESFNIFNSTKFSEGIEELLKDFISFNDFVLELDKLLMYCFWCRSEYEVMISDLFETYNEKIDIYTQVKPNIKRLAKYIIDEYNKR